MVLIQYFSRQCARDGPQFGPAHRVQSLHHPARLRNGSVDPPGTTNLPCPPLRPGSYYYLGFRAVNDATFTVSARP